MSMSKIGRHQRALFDSWTVAEVLEHIEKFEKEMGSGELTLGWSVAATQRRAELQGRVDYLRARLGGRSYTLIREIGEIHATDCPVYRAVRGSVAIECKHGYDACPQCDVCNCKLETK